MNGELLGGLFVQRSVAMDRVANAAPLLGMAPKLFEILEAVDVK